MHNSLASDGGRFAALHAHAARFGKHDFNSIVQKMINRSGRIAAAAHAGDQIIGNLPALVLQQLLPDFLADDRLQACNHIGIRVRTHGGADDIVRIDGIAAPVADCFVGGIL